MARISFQGRPRRGDEGNEPLTLRGRIVGTFCFGLFFGMGCFFALVILRDVAADVATYGWSETSCEIESARVVRTGGEEPYTPRVEYVSSPSGRRGERIHRRSRAYATHTEAHQALAPFMPGRTVTCLESARGELVLLPGPWTGGLWIGLPLVFVAIGAIGLYVSWRPTRRDRFGRPRAEPISDKAGLGGASQALIGMGAVFALAGLAMAWFFTVKPLLGLHASRSWHEETCTIEHSSVVSQTSDDGTTHRVDILYRWDRGRGTERSSRYSFFDHGSSGHGSKYQIVSRHPVGREVTCWVDPDRRNQAVIERSLGPEPWAAAVPIPIVALGGSLFGAGIVRARQRRRMLDRLSREAGERGETLRSLSWVPTWDPTPGPIALPSQSSPWGRLAGIVFAAAFWNGIVALFVSQAWEGARRGSPEWGLILFLVPFVLVGLVLIGAIFHALLALRNARARVVAERGATRLGETLRCTWQWQGPAEGIEHVRITLRGREEARYRVGTRTHTATHDFFEARLVDASGEGARRGGPLELEIPADAMHSFEATDNKIEWSLELSGEIRRWPDVNERYVVVVLPARASGKPAERDAGYEE